MKGFILAVALTLGVYGPATAGYMANKAPAEVIGMPSFDPRDIRLNLDSLFIRPGDPYLEFLWGRAETIFDFATQQYRGTAPKNFDDLLAQNAQSRGASGTYVDFYDRILGRGGGDQPSLSLYRQAADAGVPEAQVCLGTLYLLLGGSRAPDSTATAYMWLSIAAARLPNGLLLEVVDRLRIDAARGLSSEQLAEAERLARNWSPTQN